MSSDPARTADVAGGVLKHGYPARAERWIAIGRAVLATIPPIVWWAGPYEPTGYPRIVPMLLWAYVAYAWVLVAFVSRMPSTHRVFQVATHVVDLGMYALFVFLFEGRGNPFSFYFVFALVAAAIRWEWRGTLWTAAGALTLFAAISLYFSLQPDVQFALYRWINRVVFLAVIAGLVGYLGAYEGEWRREVAGLAGWSRRLDSSTDEALRVAAAGVAELLKARRIVIVWEDEDTPGCDVACWAGTALERGREPASVGHSLVAAPLENRSFFCADASSGQPLVWRTAGSGLERWEGAPLSPEGTARFAVRQLLGIRLRGDLVSGWLLALDKPQMTVDDLLLGQIVARELVAQLDNLALSGRLRRSAVSEERLRLAGDLHDGLLQSLTAAALQIEAARGKLRASPTAADEDLDKVQGLLRGEQHDLRFLIEALRPGASRRSTHRDMPLRTRLTDFVGTVQRVWQVGVTLESRGLENGLAINGEHEVYRMVQEAVINAARHAAATTIRVNVERGPAAIHVSVTDDGHGFPFEGRRNHHELAAQDLGPVSLRRRVTRLGGAITITSTRSGAQVEIDLPLETLES
jgi:signal transduction histidine kinase